MSEEDFKPLTNMLGVPGTSYKIQLGLTNNQWSSRLVKGNNVLASKVYELDEGENTPNVNYIVGWVLQASAIPNINPHQVMKSAQALMNQAKQKLEQRAAKPSITESKPADKQKETLSEAEKRKAFQEKVKARKHEKKKETSSKRTLPKIPSAQPSTQTMKAPEKSPSPNQKTTKTESASSEDKSHFCQYCGKELYKYCPFCGKKL